MRFKRTQPKILCGVTVAEMGHSTWVSNVEDSRLTSFATTDSFNGHLQKSSFHHDDRFPGRRRQILTPTCAHTHIHTISSNFMDPLYFWGRKLTSVIQLLSNYRASMIRNAIRAGTTKCSICIQPVVECDTRPVLKVRTVLKYYSSAFR